MTMQTILQFATPVSVVLGFVGLIITVNNYRKQLNVQILMKYTERYERILDGFPEDGLDARFDSEALPPESRALTLCILKYLNLCSEEFYLWKNGYLETKIWRIWEVDLKRMVASPLVKREWLHLRKEFVSHPLFLRFVESVQDK